MLFGASSFLCLPVAAKSLLSVGEFEELFAKLDKLSLRARFHIKTTEAQHYRRYVLQQQVSVRRNVSAHNTHVSAKVEDTIGRAPRGLNDGEGVRLRISHRRGFSPRLPSLCRWERPLRIAQPDLSRVANPQAVAR